MKYRPIKKRQHLLTINDLKEGYLYETVRYNRPDINVSSWYGAKVWINSDNIVSGIHPEGRYNDELYFNDEWRFKLSPLNSVSYVENGYLQTKSFRNEEKVVI